MAHRNRLKFRPEFEGPIKGWTIKYIASNYWRVDRMVDREDLMQDALFYFYTCIERYPDVKNIQHFMGLYKSCIINHFRTLSNKQTGEGDIVDVSTIKFPDSTEVTFEDVLERCGGTETNFGEITISLKEAPSEVRMFFEAMTDPEFLEVLQEKYKRKPRRKGFWTRETTNEKFCNALGLDHKKVNLVGMLRDFLAA